MSNLNNPLFGFKKAERKQCKASILIEGLTGSGKSGLALVLAKALAHDDYTKVFDIDTENGSIPLFSGIKSTSGGTFDDFQIANFTEDIGYKPSNYLTFREAAKDAGAEVIINDSISHAWSYKGGVLDILNDIKSNGANKNDWAAWGAPEVVREKNLLFSLLRDNKIHVISTVRVKEKLETVYNAEKGKNEIQSLGEQEIMQADIKYEPDLVLHMETPGNMSSSNITYPTARVVKSRYAILEKGQIYSFTPKLCEQLRKYLEEGSSPEELLQEQHAEYVTAVNEYLKDNKTKATIWKVMITDAGYPNTKAVDIPLDVLKELYIKLTLN